MDRYEQIKAGFDKNATLYQERFMELGLYNTSYDRFCELIPVPEAQILEIGCGPGNITRYLITARPDFNLLATDLAPNMVRLAQINNPTAQCVVLDAREITRLPGFFDGIICGFCLPYLSPDDCAQLISDCADLLVSGGIAYLSTIEADAQHRSGYATSSNGEDTFYVWYHQTETLKQAFIKVGLELLELMHIPYSPAENNPSIHLVFIVRKQ